MSLTRERRWIYDDQLEALIEEAFKAGYHCRWHKETGVYNFDPLLAPGDPDGAFEAWKEQKNG